MLTDLHGVINLVAVLVLGGGGGGYLVGIKFGMADYHKHWKVRVIVTRTVMYMKVDDLNSKFSKPDFFLASGSTNRKLGAKAMVSAGWGRG